MITRRGLLVAFASSVAAIGLTGLSEFAANAAKTYTVGKTNLVPIKGGKIFTIGGKRVLITQPKKGSFKAFLATCTHQGYEVNEEVRNNEIKCGFHGARFDASTGMAKAVAPRALGKVSVSVSGGNLRVKI